MILSVCVFSSLIAVTPVRVQANYLMWRSAASSMAYMTEAADKVSFRTNLCNQSGTIGLHLFATESTHTNCWALL